MSETFECRDLVEHRAPRIFAARGLGRCTVFTWCNHGQDIAGRDRVTLLQLAELGNHAGARCCDQCFHLHCCHDQQGVTDRDSITDVDEHLDHRTNEWRFDSLFTWLDR